MGGLKHLWMLPDTVIKSSKHLHTQLVDHIVAVLWSSSSLAVAALSESSSSIVGVFVVVGWCHCAPFEKAGWKLFCSKWLPTRDATCCFNRNSLSSSPVVTEDTTRLHCFSGRPYVLTVAFAFAVESTGCLCWCRLPSLFVLSYHGNNYQRIFPTLNMIAKNKDNVDGKYNDYRQERQHSVAVVISFLSPTARTKVAVCCKLYRSTLFLQSGLFLPSTLSSSTVIAVVLSSSSAIIVFALFIFFCPHQLSLFFLQSTCHWFSSLLF